MKTVAPTPAWTATITKTHGLLSMSCKVEIRIRASAERVWALLTHAAGYPDWNSTFTRVDGQIREGERLRLYLLGTHRTFTPLVSHVAPQRGMTWSDGVPGVFRGVRNFRLIARPDGSTGFEMEEHFSGLVFALVKRALPDFGPIFERFATDLRREAERTWAEKRLVAHIDRA